MLKWDLPSTMETMPDRSVVGFGVNDGDIT